MSDTIKLLTNLAFSEVDKGKAMEADAPAMVHVVLNRAKRPERFGATIEDVVFAPSQFSGVGSKEWEKAATGNMTPKEESAYKRLYQIVSGSVNGDISDPTNGADHYFNPALVKPTWAKKMKKVFTSGSHDYYKE